MSAVGGIVDKVKDSLEGVFDKARTQFLGVNNERLDFLMDSFYRLNPKQKNMVIGGIIGVGVLLAMLIIGIYLVQVNSLVSELEISQRAYSEVKSKFQSYNDHVGTFDSVTERIAAKTNSLRIKPYFEQLTRKYGVQMDTLTEKSVPLPADNPMSDSFEEVRADIRLSKISIPKLLKLLAAIESSNNFLKVDELKIQARHENKLYFDSQFRVGGYKRR